MFEEAKAMIKEANKIYVVAHINPDGDAIGSTFAIYLALKNIGKDVGVVMPACSDIFKFLPSIDECVENVNVEKYDLLIALDSSDYTRLAISDEDYKKANKVIMLDHHQIARPYGDFRYINDKKSSASEIAYLFLNDLGLAINKDIATLLYTGIMTDTGSFNYSNASPETHRVIADLLEYGAESVDVCKRLNDTIKESKLRLVARAVDNMEVMFDGNLRYSYVSYDEINELGVHDEDAEGMTNYLRSVEGTEVAVYVRGKQDGSLKVSLRSGGRVDVSKIAIHFGGGGHPRASGYTMLDELDVGKEKLIEIVGEMLNDNTSN